jgi:prophage regulatory protein
MANSRSNVKVVHALSASSHPFRVLRRQATCDLIGIKAAGLYRLVQRGQFPKPIKISTKLSGWVESEVVAWLESRIAQRVGGAK